MTSADMQGNVALIKAQLVNEPNKRQRTPKFLSKRDIPGELATQGTQDEDKQNKNITQYALDSTIHKQTQIS